MRHGFRASRCARSAAHDAGRAGLRLLVLCLLGLTALTGGTATGGRLWGAEADRVEIGEISAFSGAVRIKHVFAGADNPLQIGGKIYLGDEIETAGDATLEILLGYNVRVLFSGATAVRMNNRTTLSKQDADITRTMTRLELLLRRGTVRARVRENLVTPTVLAISAANLQVTLPRADALMRRPDTGAEQQRQIDLTLGWGRCELNIKGESDKEWPAGGGIEMSAPGQCRVPQFPEAGYLPQPQKTASQAAQDELGKLPFSVDDPELERKSKQTRGSEQDGA